SVVATIVFESANRSEFNFFFFHGCKATSTGEDISFFQIRCSKKIKTRIKIIHKDSKYST
ncbi:MAG: hypothetical protein PVI94_27665, partial [Desulfobacterales bacterium]